MVINVVKSVIRCHFYVFNKIAQTVILIHWKVPKFRFALGMGVVDFVLDFVDDQSSLTLVLTFIQNPGAKVFLPAHDTLGYMLQENEIVDFPQFDSEL